MPIVAAIYALAVEIATWGILLPWQLVRALVGRGSWGEARNRMGWSRPGPGRPRILVHAVSAGEVAAAEPLLRLLGETLPGWNLLLSAGNPTGLQAAKNLAQRLPGVSVAGYLPWDRARATRQWLQSVDPRLVVVMETELWPNLFHQCRRLNIRLALINGRIYPRDLPRYRAIRGLMGGVLACADLIGVQNTAERERFLALGAAPELLVVGGNTKFDVQPLATADPPGRSTRTDGALVLVGGSTHPPEERWLIAAFADLRHQFPGLRLVLAPRDPGRAPHIARIARARGLSALLASETTSRGEGELILLDRMGRLPGWYARADLAFVGGSLCRHGGHNILEPAAVGCPILVGPHTVHFEDIVARFRAAEALVQLQGPVELQKALALLLADGGLRRRLAENAQRELSRGRGASRTYLKHLLGLLPQ
jgi:3-deoxy-D-manno-octulosonic-acid transferase